MDLSQRPLFALCSARYEQAGNFPSFGEVVAREWDPAPGAPGGLRGLPWGVGDPAAAGLDYPSWAVVRVDDPQGPVPIPADAGAPHAIACVKFRTGRVVFLGDRRGALETLIHLGADPRALSVQLALPGEDGVASAGAYGTAVAGSFGLARAGAHGRATVQHGGLAVAGDFGWAETTSAGIAAAGRNGYAIAGEEEGLAIARGDGASATAGDFGVAVALAWTPHLRVGQCGLAVALRGAGRVLGGRAATVIIREAVENRTEFRLGEGGVAIVDFARSAGAPPHRVVARFGGGGLEPDAIHVWAEGGFRTREPEPARRDLPSQPDAPADDDGQFEYGHPLQPRSLDLDRPLGSDVLVLCSAVYDDEERGYKSGGRLAVADFDPDPSSHSGFFGLAWGIGNPRAAYPHLSGDIFSLVRVAAPIAVPPSQDGAVGRLVKFGEGEIVFTGHIADALAFLIGAGADRNSLIGAIEAVGDGEVVRVADFGVARAGRGGWAISGHCGNAEAGPGGVAMVDGSGLAAADRGGIALAHGEATAQAGVGGIAINHVKRYGKATAGPGGVAIGLGSRFAWVGCSHGGAALYPGSFSGVDAGDDAVAFGGWRTRVYAGRNGIAVSSNGSVSGAPGCLLVLIGPEREVRTAVVDEHWDVPAEFRAWQDAVAEPAPNADGDSGETAHTMTEEELLRGLEHPVDDAGGPSR